MFQYRFRDIYQQLLNDNEMTFKSNIEDKIRHILTHYLSKSDLENEFPEREQIVTDKRKSPEKSNEYYDLGNTAFTNQDYRVALTNLYNAIRYAPHHPIDRVNYLSRAFVLKSNIFSKLNRLDESLYDIQQAISLTNTLDLRLRRHEIIELRDRLNQANEQMTLIATPVPDSHQNEEVVKKELLTVHDCCLVQETKDCGRFMQSIGIIEKGTEVVKEKIQFITLTKDSLSKYCFNCFKQINYSYYPCVNCNECLFCSKQCADKSYESFHQFDCGIAGHISNYDNWNLGYRALTSIRIKNVKELKAIFNQNTGPFDMKAWIEKRNHSKEEVTDDENIEQFKAFLSFVDHIDSIPTDVILSDIFIAFEIALLIDQIQALYIEDDEDFISLTAMLIKVYRKVCYNCFCFEKIAICVSIASTMFNHSCVSNTAWKIRNGYQVLTTKTRIEFEDEITISYGKSSKTPFIERQNYLRNYYFFTCNCDLCSEQKQLYILLKCLRCGGTVYYGNQNESNYCVDCGGDNIDNDEYYEYCINNKIPLLKALFNRNIAIIYGNPETPQDFKDRSLSISERIFETISKILDQENEDLIEMREQLESARQMFYLLIPFSLLGIAE